MLNKASAAEAQRGEENRSPFYHLKNHGVSLLLDTPNQRKTCNTSNNLASKKPSKTCHHFLYIS